MSRTAVVYYEKTETYKVKITDKNFKEIDGTSDLFFQILEMYFNNFEFLSSIYSDDVEYNGETYYITITLTEEEDGDFVHYEIY